MALIQFVRNYDDLSTDRGFQFKFYCDKCGNGHMSRFQPSLIGTAGGLLRAAGDVLGGIFGQASNSAYEIQRAVGGKAHDAALETAVTEVKPHFTQCVRCGKWACKTICWNEERGLCVGCAPKLDQEIAGMQAAAQVNQLNQKIQSQDWTRDINYRDQATGLCPNCGQETGGGKFCQHCGTALAAAPTATRKFCGNCGTPTNPGSVFCSECGTSTV
jgi:hypothetical protein